MNEELEAGQAVPEVRYHDIMELFETLTFKERVHRVLEGLKQPPETGEYKWAKLQMTRLWSWASAVVVPMLAVLLMAFLAGFSRRIDRKIEVQILEPPKEEKLEKQEEIIEEEIIEPPEPMEMETESVNSHDVMMDDVEPNPPQDFAPQPAKFDSVAIVKSPVQMRGILGSRSPGARGRARGLYGGSNATEGAVMRALRWLKKHQKEDGSWDGEVGGGSGKAGSSGAMTGLALLTYLAHGETPSSPEFGKTVEKAIKWMLEKNGPDGWFTGTGNVNYGQAIATYAICEAYSMTKIPAVKEAAMRAIKTVIQVQNSKGGWNYFGPKGERSDSSVMGWATQALKAAQVAGMEDPGIKSGMKRAIQGWKSNAGAAGFGYTGPGNGGLSGVGTLSLQLLGAGEEPECKRGLEGIVAREQFTWPTGWKNIYYLYYSTQAKFHAGGEIWKNWNKAFSMPLVTAQTIEKGAGIDGKDIGYWDTGNNHGRVMDTTLCALMLQVYYRYLPTFKSPEAIDFGAEVAQGAGEEQKVIDAKDINVEVIGN